MKSPEFWKIQGGGWKSAVLRPFGWLYGVGGQMNSASATPVRASVPVICIGNVVAGGAGKTPVAIDIGHRLMKLGIQAHYLSRGYGGSETGPHQVDGTRDQAKQVGDEPLLLARTAPTWIARDRVRGAISCVEAGAGAIVMDDGLQNPSLFKDLSFCVIDGAYGLGNGRVIPAGPLRETLANAVKKSHAVVLMGDDRAGVEQAVRVVSPDVILLKASLVPILGGQDLAGRSVHAFAGIGQPDKFFDSLISIGCRVLKTTPFADHYLYGDNQISALVEAANKDQALLLTTEKDYVRLDPKWHNVVQSIGVSVAWQDDARLVDLIRPLVSETV